MPQNVVLPPTPNSTKGFSAKQVIAMVTGSMCITIVVTVLAIKIFLFPSPFKPVVLTPEEEQQLSKKLEAFDTMENEQSEETAEHSKDGTLHPEQYSEDGGSRNITFNERELNSIIAKNTDLADKLAIDLAADMVSLKLLLPLDPDFPMFGGKTLKIKTGAELAYRSGQPVVKLKGVSIMGVPMPNAWLGGLKNIDLVSEFGGDEGFWKAFADGVESIHVEEGGLNIQLKE